MLHRKMTYTKEQLNSMMEVLLKIETVLSYFTHPKSHVYKRLKYLKDMIQMGIDNA